MPENKAKSDTTAIGGQVVIEWADGRLEELNGVPEEFDLLIHDESRQAFPARARVPSYTLSLHGNYTVFEADVYYFDDELINPDADMAFVFGIAEAACVAAERGELQSDQAQTHKANMNLVAAIGGVAFPVIMALLAIGLNKGASLSWFGT